MQYQTRGFEDTGQGLTVRLAIFETLFSGVMGKGALRFALLSFCSVR